jgi:CheY-like chemotaxis protein
MATILLIDDDEQVRTLGKIDLESAGYHFVSADSGKHALRLLEDQEVDLMLVDIFMSEMDGIELIRTLRKTRPASKLIAMSAGKGVWNYLDVAKELGAGNTLEKPFTRQQLLDVVALQLGQPSKPACPKCASEIVYRGTSPSIGGTDLPFGPTWKEGWKTWTCGTCKHQWPVSGSDKLLNPSI